MVGEGWHREVSPYPDPGQDAYVKIESLDSWSTLVGAGYAAARDTFYARLMLPQIARSEIVQSFFDGGS